MNGLTTRENLFWPVTRRLIVGLAIAEISMDAITGVCQDYL